MKLSKRQLRRIIRKSMVETYDGEGRPNWDNEDKLRKAGKFDKSNISKADREEANAHIKYMEDLRKENERKREEIEKMRQERNARKGERYRHDLREEKQRLQELDFSGPARGNDVLIQLEEAVRRCYDSGMSMDDVLDAVEEAYLNSAVK